MNSVKTVFFTIFLSVKEQHLQFVLFTIHKVNELFSFASNMNKKKSTFFSFYEKSKRKRYAVTLLFGNR